MYSSYPIIEEDILGHRFDYSCDLVCENVPSSRPFLECPSVYLVRLFSMVRALVLY